jgi:hypothetical protein
MPRWLVSGFRLGKEGGWEVGRVVRNSINKGVSHCKIMESSILNSVHSNNVLLSILDF